MIIVGVAIAVGITIFNNQAYNSSQQAVATELNTYATSAMQWWKTPVAQGGSGQGDGSGALADADAATIAKWIGFGDTADAVLATDTGKFTLTSAAADGSTIVLTGCGTEKKGGAFPKVTTTVDLAGSAITSVVMSTDADGDPAE